MIDQNQFLETLRGVSEIVRTAPEPMSQEEIMAYFKDMDLSEEQREMIFQYMQLPAEMRGENPDTQEEEEEQTSEEEAAEDAETEEEDEEPVSVEFLSDSQFYRMYVDEVKQLRTMNDEEMQAKYQTLIQGDTSVVDDILNSWLMKVMEIAGYYKDCGLMVEDIIQEGNMGLWMTLQSIPDDVTVQSMPLFLTQRIQSSMEDYIREMTGDIDQVQALLAKESLLLEAEKYLMETNGREPSLRELCEYTHMSLEEIQSLITIREEAKKEN